MITIRSSKYWKRGAGGGGGGGIESSRKINKDEILQEETSTNSALTSETYTGQ